MTRARTATSAGGICGSSSARMGRSIRLGSARSRTPGRAVAAGKFVAAMQASSTSGRPVLLQVNYDNGHFTEEKIVTFRNLAGQMAFMLWQTGHQEFQPAK
jgi:hypothetical protein